MHAYLAHVCISRALCSTYTARYGHMVFIIAAETVTYNNGVFAATKGIFMLMSSPKF